MIDRMLINDAENLLLELLPHPEVLEIGWSVFFAKFEDGEDIFELEFFGHSLRGFFQWTCAIRCNRITPDSLINHDYSPRPKRRDGGHVSKHRPITLVLWENQGRLWDGRGLPKHRLKESKHTAF
jgi:hypothetical protein